MEKLRLLMVDSDPIIRLNLLELLNMHNCFRLEAELETTEEALDHILTHEVDVVFINCQPADPSRTSQGTCLPLMLESKYPDIQVIAYSGSPEDAYSAVRNGCSGFFTLPAEPVDLHRIVNRLCYIYQLQRLRDETAHSSTRKFSFWNGSAAAAASTWRTGGRWSWWATAWRNWSGC